MECCVDLGVLALVRFGSPNLVADKLTDKWITIEYSNVCSAINIYCPVMASEIDKNLLLNSNPDPSKLNTLFKHLKKLIILRKTVFPLTWICRMIRHYSTVQTNQGLFSAYNNAWIKKIKKSIHLRWWKTFQALLNCHWLLSIFFISMRINFLSFNFCKVN